MNTNLDPEFVPALLKLEELNELSLRMLERINFAGPKEILLQLSQRQELIEQLHNLDVFQDRIKKNDPKALPRIIQNEFNKLLSSGEMLIRSCNQRLKAIEKAKRQSAVTRAAARSYRPKYSSTLSSGSVDI